MTDAPAYLRIAAEIRAKIMSGELGPGAKIPSEARIMKDYGVSNTTAKYAVSMLKSEGLVEGRFGSGVYVRTVQRITRKSTQRNSRSPSGTTSPFARDVEQAGHQSRWEHDSERTTVDEEIARRLAIEVGDPVMRTEYRFFSDDAPVQLSTSWEPLAITAGTPIEFPEAGDVVGVVARMDTIGVHIDEFVEVVVGRSASPTELEQLGLSGRGTNVLAVERTYYAAGRPVETADIVFSSSHYRLEYRAPVN